MKHIARLMVLLGLVAAGTRGARAAGESGEAEALIRQGVELRSQGKDERALPLFEKAYQQSRSPRTAGQLGLVEMALGYYVDAERYLGEALAAPDHPWVAKNLATLKSQFAAAKGMIGELAISGEPMGAEVWVNGKQVGRLPLPAPIRLDKGRAEIQIRAAGYVATSDTVAITGGKREDRTFHLAREAVAAPVVTPVTPAPAATGTMPMPKPAETQVASAPGASSPAATSSAPGGATATVTTTATGGSQPASDGSSLRPYAWGAAGGAALGLIFGTIEGLSAIKKKNEFNEHKGADGSFDCGTDAPNLMCKAIQDSHGTARTLSIVGFSAGVALAGASAVLFVMSSPGEAKSGTTSALACVPDVVSRGVSCRLQF
jgi:hypothetical protein